MSNPGDSCANPCGADDCQPATPAWDDQVPAAWKAFGEPLPADETEQQ